MKHEIFIQHHRVGLRMIKAFPGMSPLPGFYFSMGAMILFLIFQIWNAIVVFSDLDKLMDNLVSTVGVVTGLLKVTALRSKHRSLMSSINIILEDCNDEYRKKISTVFSENSIRARLVSKLIIVLYNTMNFTYFLKTIMSYIIDTTENRKFLAEVSFPIDAKQSPIYEIVVIAQFITACICFNYHAFIEGLLATMVFHACSKVNILRQEIIKFSIINQRNYNGKKTLFILRKLHNKHLKFIEFSKSLQDIFSSISFFHIFFLTLIQVMSGYMFIDVLERGTKSLNLVHYAVLTISLLISTGYYCIAGQYLTIQSEQLFIQLYNCMWYEFQTSEKKLLSFMLLNARKSITLKVGKFNNLSLYYLTSIIKTSYSYLSLVRTAR